MAITKSPYFIDKFFDDIGQDWLFCIIRSWHQDNSLLLYLYNNFLFNFNEFREEDPFLNEFQILFNDNN
jgi:hypothetical protein